ncbi:response regulator [Dendronalium sp. ChiSLP03b]|uniref:response regulator n=1 Tax=Dendronalium sp. ChiSLP03b TaxID=3075381 RepID=UPI002AD59D2D|nr:response regulator [Dendronalium sp. ChiSLP03b]MDZ8205903.1 response regulator [Dendronalium sp. ChiSLP03b]
MYSQPISVDGLHLLVIDDDADTRKILTILFQMEGAEILAVGSVNEALEVLSYFNPDILISDIYLSDELGYSSLTKVRNLVATQGKWIPAIALTGFASETERAYAYAIGFQMHICKPINLDELVCAVASLADCKQLV